MKYLVTYIATGIAFVIFWSVIEFKFTGLDVMVIAGIVTLLSMGSDIIDLLKDIQNNSKKR